MDRGPWLIDTISMESLVEGIPICVEGIPSRADELSLTGRDFSCQEKSREE